MEKSNHSFFIRTAKEFVETRQKHIIDSWINKWYGYHFDQEWVVNAPLETVWEGLIHVDQWYRWWEGLEFSNSTDNLPVTMTGKQYITRWKGSFPYYLDIQAVIVDARANVSISADIHGDIKGACTCRIEKTRDGTRGFFSLNVHTCNPWMTILSPFLKERFSKNHNSIMAKGIVGFTSYLAQGK